ncbi:hypothetical protein [Arthrobacter sp. CG_A4]|uniref:hypothetical protein n=1 Tax=Arthrobacter sp. CG_A4 TaxID=3071706 RepID=UPI002E005A08|nr:hypothetical protein [Arthrobacter sp. CG_A4]
MDSLNGRDHAWADRWEELSFGVVALGPTLFVTSFLAMASQMVPRDRWIIRVLAVLVGGGILVGLYTVSPKIHVAIVLSLVGILYSLGADIFTPDDSDKPKRDNDSQIPAADVSVASAELEPRGETLQVNK